MPIFYVTLHIPYPPHPTKKNPVHSTNLETRFGKLRPDKSEHIPPEAHYK